MGKKQCALGPLSPRSKGTHWQAPRIDFSTPIVVKNATMPPGSLSLTNIWTSAHRPGADDHRRYHSRGI